MNEDVKNEFCNVLFCYGCLSNDRKTVPLGDYTEMFYNLLDTDGDYVYGSDDVRLCWECVATLRKVKQFRSQIQEAQSKLVQYMYQLETNKSLSRLKEVYKNNYDQQFEYDPYIKCDKDEITTTDTEIYNDSYDVPLFEDTHSNDTFYDDIKIDTSFNDTSISTKQSFNDFDTIIHNKCINDIKTKFKDVSVKLVRCKIDKSVKDNNKICGKSVKSNTKSTFESVKSNTKSTFKSVKSNTKISAKSNTKVKEETESNTTTNDKSVTTYTISNNKGVTTYTTSNNKGVTTYTTSNDKGVTTYTTSNDKSVTTKSNDNELTIKTEDIKIEPELKFSEDCFKKSVKKKKNNVIIPRDFVMEPRTDYEINWKDVRGYFEKCYITTKEIDDNVRTMVLQKRIKGHRFKCVPCQVKYIKIDDYKRHCDTVHYDNNPPYKCSLCQRVMPTIDRLQQHWVIDHQRYEKCKLCGDHVRNDLLKKHLRYEHTKIFKCIRCKREYGSLWRYDVHYRKHHQKLICDYCGKTFVTKIMIEKHMRYHTDLKCDICNKTFIKYHSYQNHLRMFHPEQMNIKVDRELAYCVECDIQYPSIDKYKAHLKSSVKHKKRQRLSIPCPVCHKIFRKNIYMKNHYSKFHLQQTKHYCGLCDKYYANGWGLKVHNANVHLKIPKPRDKICDLCGRGFYDNKILRNHRRTHTGERPYKCMYCSATFGQRTAMMSHQKTQHRDMQV